MAITDTHGRFLVVNHPVVREPGSPIELCHRMISCPKTTLPSLVISTMELGFCLIRNVACVTSRGIRKGRSIFSVPGRDASHAIEAISNDSFGEHETFTKEIGLSAIFSSCASNANDIGFVRERFSFPKPRCGKSETFVRTLKQGAATN